MVVMWADCLAATTAGSWAAMLVGGLVAGTVAYLVEKTVACSVVQ